MRSSNHGTPLGVDGPNQPFATMYMPSDAQTERDPKRLKLLKVTTPIAVLVALVGLWLISLFLWTTATKSDWKDGNYAGAISSYEKQMAVTSHFPQPWLAQYNLGSSMIANGDLDRGIGLLREAFQGVPKAVQGEKGAIQPFAYECYVRMNLSAGLELQGDAQTASGNDNAAKKLYESALEWISPCEVPSGGGGGESPDQDGNGGQGGGEDQQNQNQDQRQGKQGNEAGDRLRDKLNQGQENQQDQQPQPSQPSDQNQGQGQAEQQGGQDPFQGETPEERQRREELQNKNQQQAERERQRSEQQNRGLGGGW